MSTRCRQFTAALGLTIIFVLPAGTQSAEQSTGYQPSAHWEEDGSEHGSLAFSVPVNIVDMPEQTESVRQEQQEARQREIENLATQKSMVESTQKIVWLTGLQFALAALGAGALFYTLHLTRQSTRAANVSAQAARDTIGTERAWLVSNATTCDKHQNLTLDGVLWPDASAFSIKWVNAGRSPAINATIIADIQVTGLSDPAPVFQSASVDEVSPAIIGQGLGGLSSPMYLTGADFHAFYNHQKRAFLYSKVTYNDVFTPNTKRVSEACFSISYLGTGTDEAGAVIENYSVRAEGNQNTAN